MIEVDETVKSTLFGALFIVANRLQVLGDRLLEENKLTMKQWLLAVAVEKLFDHDPSVSETASIIGSSRQNVKQLALKLEKRGFMIILEDPLDKRIQRLKVDQSFHDYWSLREDKDEIFLDQVFENIDHEKLKTTVEVLFQLNNNIETIN